MKKKTYVDVPDRKCIRKKCYVPFAGNGRATCRLYELGQCVERKEVTK